MTWADIAGDRIRVVQQKTDEKLTIPLHPTLQAELARAPREHVVIVTSRKRKPYAGPGLRQMVGNAIAKAGLPARCTPHGLRKAAARRLAEAGATSKEIAAVTGHRSLAEVERYTKAADQELLARQAIEKQTAGENESRLRIVKGDAG
jgi:integrase